MVNRVKGFAVGMKPAPFFLYFFILLGNNWNIGGIAWGVFFLLSSIPSYSLLLHYFLFTQAIILISFVNHSGFLFSFV